MLVTLPFILLLLHSPAMNRLSPLRPVLAVADSTGLGWFDSGKGALSVIKHRWFCCYHSDAKAGTVSLPVR